MTQPTKAQWEEVKEKLSLPYGSACLRCDNYLILAEVRQSKMKLVIQIYVNGWIRGEWWWHGKESNIGQMPEIARRFYCVKRKSPSAKTKAVDIKIFGKKYCRDKRLHEPFLSVLPWFNSPGSFIAHLKKHNPTIEVLDSETYKLALRALPEDQDEKSAKPAEAVIGEEHA